MSTNCVKCAVNKRTRLDLLCDPCGKEKDKDVAMQKALSHALNRLHSDPYYAWYMVGTETLALMIKAAALQFDMKEEDVRKLYDDVAPKDPMAKKEDA